MGWFIPSDFHHFFKESFDQSTEIISSEDFFLSVSAYFFFAFFFNLQNNIAFPYWNYLHIKGPLFSFSSLSLQHPWLWCFIGYVTMIAPPYVRFKSVLTVSLSNTFFLDVWRISHNISVFSDIVEILPWVTFIFCDGNLFFCPFCIGTYR